MKIFTAGIVTETNTFAPSPTGMAAFAGLGLGLRRRGSAGEASMLQPTCSFLEEVAAGEGHTLRWGLTAFAMPGGPTLRAVWQALRDELLSDLRAAMPVDAVVLQLHGAMVAEGQVDCEGELLAAVRAIVGPQVPVGASLDPHCHYTEAMRSAADVLVCFKHYPHTDIVVRLADVWRLTLAAARGEIHPVTEVFDCRMVNFWHTTREPMISFVRRMQQLENQPGVLSVNFGHGFPYGDVPDVGAKVWVTTDRDAPLAATLARELGMSLYAMRDQTMSPVQPLDATLDQMLICAQTGRPVVIADRADNAGGGAPSDSTFVLRRLLERRIGNVALGAFFDLGAVQTCLDAGLGARLKLRVGGKIGPVSGDPVDLAVTVRGVAGDHSQTGLAGSRDLCGHSVWVATDEGIDLVLISVRQQVLAPDMFTGLGIALDTKQAVVVKSSQHFHARFAKLAAAVLYADTPGLLRCDFENMPYQHRDGNFWPRVATPWAPANT